MSFEFPEPEAEKELTEEERLSEIKKTIAATEQHLKSLGGALDRFSAAHFDRFTWTVGAVVEKPSVDEYRRAIQEEEDLLLSYLDFVKDLRELQLAQFEERQ